MAAKSKAAPQGKVAHKGKATTKAKSRPKGLQLTTAQAAAYNKAFSATAQKLSKAAFLKGRATGFRKYRLQSAYSSIKQANKYTRLAQTAAIAAHATQMTKMQARLGHQNVNLQQRIAQDVYRHTQLMGRAQFAQAGVKAYAHAAVMRTVTQKQALAVETAFYNKLLKTARKAGRPRGRPKGKGTPLSKSIARAAAAAGAAAAAKIPKTRGRPKGSIKGAPTAKAKAQNIKTNQAAAAASAKAAPKAAKTRTAPVNWAMAAAAHAQAAYARGGADRGPEVKKALTENDWHGDEITPNCVVVAIANHLLWSKQVTVDDNDLKTLAEELGDEPTIEGALWHCWLTGWPASHRVRLVHYSEASEPSFAEEGYVIGYDALTDDGWQPHCALSRPLHRVVSWGKERDREALVEEAWELSWQV